MEEFDFELIFKLTDDREDSNEYINALFENGCNDATISTGQLGVISLSFNREANSASEAVCSAINDIQKAIPSAKLIEKTARKQEDKINEKLIELSHITKQINMQRHSN